MNTSSANYLIETSYESSGDLVIRIKGKMNFSNARNILQSISSIPKGKTFASLQLDISRVESFDASAAAILLDFMKKCAERGHVCTFTGNTEKFDNFLQLLDLEDLMKPGWTHTHKRMSFPVHIGDEVIKFLLDVKETIIFLGGLLYGLIDAIRIPRKIRWSETLYFMEQSGSNAFPIVALISFLIGFIMAFQSAGQFQTYGAQIYVADLVGLIITRELGPVMTAIILAGRSGGAFSAEIGTMKVSEEIDALSTMGFDVFRFLITPKIIALNIMLPCLTLLADVIGITTLNLSFVQYVNETYYAIDLSDIIFGLWIFNCRNRMLPGNASHRWCRQCGKTYNICRSYEHLRNYLG